MLFQRLFAAYYLLLIKLRRIKLFRLLNRGNSGDFGTLCFVMLTQFYLLCLITYLLKLIIGFRIPRFSKEDIYVKVTFVILWLIWLYFSNKYFISNRERRNKFIDSLRNLNYKQRLFWELLAYFTMLTPVWFLIYIIIRDFFSV